MMKQPVAFLQQLKSFLLNVLPQMAQNIAVKLSIGCLAIMDEFMVHNLLIVKENVFAFHFASNLPRLF